MMMICPMMTQVMLLVNVMRFILMFLGKHVVPVPTWLGARPLLYGACGLLAALAWGLGASSRRTRRFVGTNLAVLVEGW